jgi:hypothetical protein
VLIHGSLGEQSVGKSFALNHLVDTSFAGSAMRTTEGVWMSVNPTDDALIVALDFEGNSTSFNYIVPAAETVRQVFTASSDPPKKTPFLFCSTPLSLIWYAVLYFG